MRRITLAVCLAASACGSWQRGGSEQSADPSMVVPRLFDAAGLYETMGLLAARDPLAFVASVRFMAAATPESTLAIVGVSLANNALSFRRAGDVFEARYQVAVSFRREGSIVQQFSRDESVRVSTFQETLRADESVIFQRFVRLAPGSVSASIALRDRFGSGFSRAQRTIEVPQLGARPGLSAFVPVYRANPRPVTDSLPRIVVNPRATVSYGNDTLAFYVEAYRTDGSVRVIARALPRDTDEEVWRDSVELEGQGDLVAGLMQAPPHALPVGELVFEAFLDGWADTLATNALVSFSDQWVVSNFDETLSLLRYFGQESARRALRGAALEERSELWKAFWNESDPDPSTSQHEALDAYFRRLQEANERFEEPGQPGWLTDRGEVYITLGEPDETFDSSSDPQGRGQRIVRWTYISHRLSLDFVDETGFGRFRLTTSSRQEYLTVLNRVRRNV